MPRKFYESVRYAWRGIRFSFRTQRNLAIHAFVAVIAVLLAVILNFNMIEMSIVLMVIASVIVLELVNTAMEEIVNMMTIQRKLRAMVAKDVSAAAVLVAVSAAVAIGCVLYLPKLFSFLMKALL